MPYFTDSDNIKKYQGKIILNIEAKNVGNATINFTDGTGLNIIAFEPSPRRIEGRIYEHPLTELIINQVKSG